MIRLIVEKTLLVKELWQLPEDYDLSEPLHLQGTLLSRRDIPALPIIHRPYLKDESLEPTLGDRSRENAEIGAWKRLMKLWKG